MREKVVGFVKPRNKSELPQESKPESTPELEPEPATEPAPHRPKKGDKVAFMDRLRLHRDSGAESAATNAQPVKLSSPPEIYEADSPRYATHEPAGVRAQTVGSAGTVREDVMTVQPRSRDVRRNRPVGNQDPLSIPAWRGDSRWQQPGELPQDGREPQTVDMVPSNSGSGQLPPDPFRANPAGTEVSEPVRLPAPPVLERLPSDGGLEARQQNHRSLSIPHIALCQEVRSFEDYTELDATTLVPGQPVLIYATLTNYQSDQTPQGYRTLTTSALEVRLPNGDLVVRQPLGTATDVARTPRRDFFLTHQVRVPADLGVGDYVFLLTVYDLIGKRVGQSQIAVRVTEDRTHLGEMADTSGSATGLAGSPR